jgi:endonuclease-3
VLNKEQISEMCEIFIEWNECPKTELYFTNTFTFAVAVILSAQATDKSVNKITSELFKEVSRPKDLTTIGEAELKNRIRSIGLFNNKAKNLILLSNELVEKFDSNLPMERKTLETLPGIGRKSANVILNLMSTDGSYIAVDTHVARTASRLGISNFTSPQKIEDDLIKKIPKRFHKNISNWLVLHGRYVCKSRHPECSNCILKNICKFQNKDFSKADIVLK